MSDIIATIPISPSGLVIIFLVLVILLGFCFYRGYMAGVNAGRTRVVNEMHTFSQSKGNIGQR